MGAKDLHVKSEVVRVPERPTALELLETYTTDDGSVIAELYGMRMNPGDNKLCLGVATAELYLHPAVTAAESQRDRVEALQQTVTQLTQALMKATGDDRPIVHIRMSD